MTEKETRLWNLKFGMEASIRYHERRRATLESYAAIVKVISIVGAMLAFGTVSTSGLNQRTVLVVAITSAIIAFINLVDLVFHVDERARLHRDLYRQFKFLQERMARSQKEWTSLLNDWEADAQTIRVDEPPVLYAVYVECWNSTVEKFGADKSKYSRKITWTQRLFQNYVRFQSHDFPAVS